MLIEFARFKITNQRLADQVSTIIKKCQYTDFDILDLHPQIYREACHQAPNRVTETLNTEKPVTPNQKETLSNSE